MAVVLLVDDHADLRDVVGQMLSLHGHEVHFSESGEHAIASLSHCRPDVVIVDHRLPGISGIELLRRLRDDPVLQSLPVIMYSADDSLAESARRAGADDFWVKGSDGMFDGVARLAGRLGKS
jgi:CheY-like chemotaxis protein